MNNINRNVTASFALCITLLGATAMVFWRNAQRTMLDARSLIPHHRVVSSLQDATLELFRSERAQRDFILTGGRAALEESQGALFNLERALAKATEASVEQGSREALARLGDELSLQVRLVQGAFEAMANSGRRSATRMLEAPESALRLGSIGRQVEELRRLEAERLGRLSSDIDAHERQGRRWMFVSMGLALLLFGALGLLINRELKRRAQAEQMVQRQEQTLRSILRDMQDGVVVVGKDGQVLNINPAAQRLLGPVPADESVKAWLERGMYSDESLKPAFPDGLPIARALEGDAIKDAPFFLRNASNPDGLHVAVSANPVRDDKGDIHCAVAVLRDASREHEGREESHRTAKELRDKVQKVEARNQQIGLLGSLTRTLQACNTSQELCTASEETLRKLFPDMEGHLHILNNSKTLLVPSVAWAPVGFKSAVLEAFSPQDCWAMRRGQPHGVRPDRPGPRCAHLMHQHAVWSLCQPLAGQGEMLGILNLSARSEPSSPGSAANLAALICEQLGMGLANLRLREKLHVQSIRDSLTGLYNRRYLEEVVERELERSRRSGSPLCVVALDIDHFKHYNDQYGHDAGDQVLRQLSHCLRERARSSDIVCRTGGEEILVLMPDAELEEASAFYDGLQETLRGLDLFYLGRRLEPITLSAGLASFPKDGDNFPVILQRADSALYEAKKRGRNRSIFWRQMGSAA